MRLFCILLLLCGCTGPSSTEPSWQVIAGRDELSSTEILRYPVYRAKVPSDWHRIDPDPKESIVDSTKPLCQFLIEDEVVVFVHNFPNDSLEKRIPTRAQVSRWQRQFKNLSPQQTTTKPESHGGFAGLFFSATGTQNDQETTVLAWAMQLGEEQWRNLNLPGDYFKQMRSDYTIKAVGPPEKVKKHAPSIKAFARSFELIDEIPSP